MGKERIYTPDTAEDIDDLEDWVFLFIADVAGEVRTMDECSEILVEYIKERKWKTHTYRNPDGTRGFELNEK